MSSCSGISATQRRLATAAGKPVSVFIHGVDEVGLRRAARAFGVKSDFVLFDDRSKGKEFAPRLRAHLRQANPAILLTKHFDHWVAVIGYLALQRKFIIVDPMPRPRRTRSLGLRYELRIVGTEAVVDLVERGEIHLYRRQYFHVFITPERNVKFTAIDEIFNESRLFDRV